MNESQKEMRQEELSGLSPQEQVDRFGPAWCRQAAAIYAKHVPSCLDKTGLDGVAWFGLRAALEDWKPERATASCSFKSFAFNKMRFAIVDMIRDEMGRDGKKMPKFLIGNPAFSNARYRKPRCRFGADALHEHGDRERMSHDSVVADRQPDPVETIVMKDEAAGFVNGSNLTDEERRVIHDYYHECRTMRAIAADMNCSESKVSLLHSSAISKMRRKHNRELSEERRSLSALTN